MINMSLHDTTHLLLPTMLSNMLPPSQSIGRKLFGSFIKENPSIAKLKHTMNVGQP
jgi:hypothetical protein